jgi:hypothetical protein
MREAQLAEKSEIVSRRRKTAYLVDDLDILVACLEEVKSGWDSKDATACVGKVQATEMTEKVREKEGGCQSSAWANNSRGWRGRTEDENLFCDVGQRRRGGRGHRRCEQLEFISSVAKGGRSFGDGPKGRSRVIFLDGRTPMAGTSATNW